MKDKRPTKSVNMNPFHSPSKSKLLTERWIVLPDCQIPYHDPLTLAAVESYMADHRWDGYINLGDFLDFNELSRYNEGSPGSVQERVAETFAAGREILTRHVKLIRRFNVKARLVLIEGNHDFRATDYCLRHPELEGFLDVAKNLELKQLGIEWIRSWATKVQFRVGKAGFVHGNKTGLNHARAMVNAYGENIFYGHTHDIMETAMVRVGHDNVLVGKSLGCLCEYDQRYLKGNPTAWQQAFAVFHFFPDGYFNEFVVKIFKHRFVSPEGKVYGGD